MSQLIQAMTSIFRSSATNVHSHTISCIFCTVVLLFFSSEEKKKNKFTQEVDKRPREETAFRELVSVPMLPPTVEGYLQRHLR